MKLFYGWVIVAVGALMTCVAIGAMFSLAVYLQPMSADTGWSRAGISSAMTLDFLAMGVAGFGWGAVSDRFGTRIVVLTGRCCSGSGWCWRAGRQSLLEFQLDLRRSGRPCRRRLLRADDRGSDRPGLRPIAASRFRSSRPAWAWRR